MKKLLTICLIYFSFGQNLFAQTPHFRNYTVDDGLPSSHVYRAFQDSKGFMWFCTDKGIARFDGYKFEKFTTKNGIPNNDVWHCAEDSQQRIWFLSYANAFFYFDLKDGKFHVIANPYKDSHDAHVWCYVEERKDSLVATLSNQKFLFINLKTGKVTSKKEDHLFGKTSVNYPLAVNKHFLHRNEFFNGSWLVRSFSENLVHNIKKTPHVIPKINEIDIRFWNKIKLIQFDDDKTIYANNDSIFIYKEGKFFSRQLNSLSEIRHDNLIYIFNAGISKRKFVVTENETFIIDESLGRIKSLDFVDKFELNTIFFDHEENLWLCSKNKGIYLISKDAINSNSTISSNGESITCISKDYLNNVWFGTDKGNLFFIRNDNKQVLEQKKINTNFNSPLKKITISTNKILFSWVNSSNIIMSLSKAINDNVIITQELIIDNMAASLIEKPNKNSETLFKGLGIKSSDVTDDDNTFLVGGANELSSIKDFKTKYIRNRSLIPNTKITTVLFSKCTNLIYAGTNKGIIIVTKNTYKNIPNSFKQKYPILTKPISSFVEDNQNALWTGTDGYGVYRLHQNKVIQIPELAGIIVNHLYFEKENNRLFVSTNEGIFVIKLKSKGSGFTYSIKRISLAQGLPTLEVNAVVVRDNELFVATSKGLAVLPLQNMDENDGKNIAMPLLIKNIKINRQDTAISQFYDLNYRQNNLDIDFVALSYKSDKNIKYEYKLIADNNTDTLWHATTDLHKEFSLLSPGKYAFMLRAFDIDGYPAKPIKPIVFVINPPFWQTLWFKILVASLIIGGIILFFYLRTLNIKKKEQEKTEVNKKFAELELQALQAQMNPHFVFNALSAIQNFILNNNTEEATDYLSRFSRLMRLFLESSRNKYIALSDEKNLLEHYIKLEELRFKDKFSSEITVDENVSLDTEIPSMLLQPFVENAINHGLVYKENNDGLLSIHFSRNEDKLVCIVEDNGIGRTKAAEIKNKSLKPYKSRSTEITEDRLRSLELIENTKIEIDILDKLDENNVPMGTKVTIVMYL
jgi:ligand-binding sensor domain-containing protein